MQWHDVIPKDEIWEGEIIPAQIAEKEIFLFRIGDVIRAYVDECPHQMNPLSDGKLAGKILACKTHQWRFDLETGCGVNPASSRLTSFPVRVEGGVVQVALTPES